MFCSFVFCSLCFGNLVVFGNSDAVKVVRVTEGDTVTLQTNVTQLLEKDLISWTFEDPESRIAEINKEAGSFSTYDNVPDGRFRNRLKLDHQTGSLNITNSSTTDSGLYEMTIKSKKENTYRFSVTVYARLPVPVISGFSQCSSLSICSLECSSVIVGPGSLSWYKENLLWSSVSVSDLSNDSLPLVVQYQDKNTYSCVLKNPISNQTTHLNFTQLCGTCAGIQRTSRPRNKRKKAVAGRHQAEPRSMDNWKEDSEHQRILFKLREMIRLIRKQEDIAKKIMKLVKEFISLNKFYFELNALTSDLETLRLQTSSLTNRKAGQAV